MNKKSKMKKMKKSNILLYFVAFIFMLFSVNAEYPATFVDLGLAGNFTVLSATAITSASASSVITGDIGISPAAGSFITVACSELTGNIYQPDATYPGTTDPATTCALSGTANAGVLKTYVDTAILDIGTAYTAATGGANLPASNASFLNLGAGTLTAQTLTPGVYTWGSTLDITGDITLDCGGNSSEVFVFQVGTDLDLATTKQIILAGNCQASNIFWAVGGTTVLNAASHLEGNVITGPGTTEITLIASTPGVTVNGRLLGTKTIALQDNSAVTIPDETPTLTTITLLPVSANVTLADTLQLNVTTLDQFGSPINTSLTYTSSNSSIVSVNASGGVTAVNFGIVVITAQNGSINDTSNITVPAPTPTLSSIGSKSVVQNNTLYFVITSSTSNNLSLTFNLTGKPGNATFTDNLDGTANFNWTPNSSDVGLTSINFSVSNGFNNDNEIVVIRINLSPPPVTNVTNPGSSGSNVNFNVTLNASGTNSTIDYINYTLNGVPGQIIGDSGNILINTVGNNTIIYYAVDSLGNVEDSITIYAILDNTSANITLFSLSSSSVYTGDTITGTCLATDDFDNNPDIVISGIDTSSTGTKTAICTVTDASGNINTSSLNYTVNQRSSGGGGGSSSGDELICNEWTTCVNSVSTQSCTQKNGGDDIIKEKSCNSGTVIISNDIIVEKPTTTNTGGTKPSEIKNTTTVNPTDVKVIDNSNTILFEKDSKTTYVPKKENLNMFRSFERSVYNFTKWIGQAFTY